MRISLSASSAPLFYISTHGSLSSKPSIELTSSANPASPPLAHADLHRFSSDTDVAIFSPAIQKPSPLRPLLTTTFQKSRVFSTAHTFTIPIPNGRGSQTQTFEWRSSSGPEVRALQGRSHGVKLVTAGGAVVAVWAPPMSGNNKKGKMAFMEGARE
ncbi:hypothetical protein LAWI1_G008911, partial [Lachnellula willkommii]